MTNINISDYSRNMSALCRQNDFIPEELYQKYGVNRGLRDINGKGVLTGLTNISKIISFKDINGIKAPVDGELWYRGYKVHDLIKGIGPGEFGFEKIAYLLLFGQMPRRNSMRTSTVCLGRTVPCLQISQGMS